MLFAEDADQRERDGIGAAGFGHHLAKHGAEGDHDGDVPEGSADAGLEGVNHARHRHSGDDGERQRSKQQAEEWVEFENGDQQDESDDGAQRAEQQKDAVGIDHRLAGFRKMTARLIGATRLRREARKRPARSPVSP